MSIGLDANRASATDGPEATVHSIEQGRRDKRAWTIKGIGADTVDQARKAAQSQGMLLSLWVDKKLRDAAEKEIQGEEVKSLAAEIMCAKIDSIEASLKEYLIQQDRRIAELQKEVHSLSTSIVAPLIKIVTDAELHKKRA